MIVGELAAILKLDDTAYYKGLDKAKGAWMKIGSDLKGIGQTLTAGVTAPLLLIAGATTKMAMEAVESENLFEVSMGNMAKSARDWSEQLRKDLGLNAYEVRKNVGVFYNMFTSMKLGEKNAYQLSTGLTQLAYDMSSFYNISPEEAFEKLSSGITGEIEPLKRLGILVNEETVKQYAYQAGIAKSGQALTEQQKVMARYLAILDQTKNAQGDLARTIDSPTNQLRIMQGELRQTAIDFGMALLPALKEILVAARPFLDMLKSVTAWFNGLDDSTRKAIVTTLGFMAALGPLVWALGSLIGAGGRLLPVFMSLFRFGGNLIFAFKAVAGGAATVGEAFAFLGKPFAFLKSLIIGLGKAMLWLVTTPAGWITIAVIAIAALAYLLIKNWKQAGPFFVALWNLIKNTFWVGWAGIKIILGELQLGLAKALNFMYGGVARFVVGLIDAFSWLEDIPGLGWLVGKMRSGAQAVDDILSGFEASSAASLDAAKGDWAEATDALTTSWGDLKDTGTDLGHAMMGTMKDTIASAKGLFGGAEKGADGLEDMKKAADNAAYSVEDLNYAVGDLQKKTGKKGDLTDGLYAVSDAGLSAARAIFERSMAIGNLQAADTALSVMRNATGFGPAGAVTGGSKQTLDHTGTIRVEGVNNRGQVVAVVDLVASEIRSNQDRFAGAPSGRRVFK